MDGPTSDPARRRWRRRLAVLALAALALGPGLGAWARLSYHEAIVAQGAREMLAGAGWQVPTLGGRPWLEKPPLAHWLAALLGALRGRIDEAGARLPTAIASTLLALAVAELAARRFGPAVGVLAGAVQATTAWGVARGRLADADMLLACLTTWAIVALDRMRGRSLMYLDISRRGWDVPFFALLGATALVKGVGFGAAMVGSALVPLLVWDRDGALLRRLLRPLGVGLGLGIALAWPALVLARHPEALGLWLSHTAGRFGATTPFASDPWPEYLAAPLVWMLPWTPLALAGAWGSARRAAGGAGRYGADRLLWAWAVAPALLVTMARARSAHYLLPALPPWSVWAALGLARLGAWLEPRGWSAGRLGRIAALLFLGVAIAWGIGFAMIGPRLDGRGKGSEWAFYAEVGRALPTGASIALLYDAPDRPDRWDRQPYPTPFGPVPPDLAVRLFYVGRPARWHLGVEALAAQRPLPDFVVARTRDRPALARLGRVACVARGPDYRPDRAFVLFRLAPRADPSVQTVSAGDPVR
jgi:4-amino-4-deoxy-L-arabinose transferase-like glycosyltransferase